MEWVSAKELLTALNATTAWPSSVTLAVCRRAFAGELDTIASAVVIGTEKRRDQRLPTKFWWAGGHEALEQDWERGDFSTMIETSVGEREMKAFGVRFSRHDAERMGAEFPPKPIISLDVFAEADREAGRRWRLEQWWPWIDAVAWVANRSPDAMELLAAYRALHLRSPGSDLINEGARFTVGQSLMKPSSMREAEAELLQALRLGEIASRGAATPEGQLSTIDPAEWSRLGRPSQYHVARQENDPPAIVFHDVRLSTRDLLARWPDANAERAPNEPVPPAEPDPPVAQPAPTPTKIKGRSGPKVDSDWKAKVYDFCKKSGRKYVAGPVGGRVFLSDLKKYYRMGEADGPRDHRRTQMWRQQWLDEQAGLETPST
ncbi:MAG TPA: hypothetical protein VF631_10925 [Allosphingosinicella sp.]|jgi:hypothetical protein|uniref:hypothetical protein n=1 Tax=Allosphingosinicella sp. TaxID=2823234 RepID=UPI002F26EA07